MTPSQPDSEVPADSLTPPESEDNPSTSEAAASTPGTFFRDTASPLMRAGSLDRALDLVRFLRANCEWDAAQTPASLVRYLLEEAHETAEAIRSGDDTHLTAELGDLLLNVAFQIVIAEERGTFTADDVTRTLESKMRRRHPHLYGDGPRVDWDELKLQERAAVGVIVKARAPRADDESVRSVLDGLDTTLEPLPRAHTIQARVAAVGFDWPNAAGAFAKVREEVEEVGELLESAGFPATPGDTDCSPQERLEEEIGDLLFAVVNLARLSSVDSTQALRRANAKFSGRFRQLERLARERGLVLGEAPLEELDRLWDEIKD